MPKMQVSQEERAAILALRKGGEAPGVLLLARDKKFARIRKDMKDLHSRLDVALKEITRLEASGADPKLSEELIQDVQHDGQVITLKSRTVRTLDAALKTAKVDLAIWEVERYIVNKWDCVAKTSSKKIAPHEWKRGLSSVELWQVKVWLRRKMPKSISDAVAELFEKYKTFKAQPIKRFRKKVTEDKHLLELALFDSHFGKLAWAEETGEDYDLHLAELVYENAIDDLVDRTKGYNIDRILYPVGQDFFHVNNWLGTTEQGTQVDLDTRFQKVFDVGVKAVVRAIDRCRAIAPVKMLWVPGNHDIETSWYLVRVLQAWYRNTKHVEIDMRAYARKYEHYGVNLIGFTHGDEEPHRDLPAIMAGEVPDKWAASTCRTWHLGHLHKKKQMHYNAGDTFGAVRVLVLPSLSGTDAWHYRKGYVKNNRAAEAYLWSKKEGYVGHFSALARET